MRKELLLLIMGVLLAVMSVQTVFASAIIAQEALGSITIDYKEDVDGEEPIVGAVYTCYKVAVYESDINASDMKEPDAEDANTEAAEAVGASYHSLIEGITIDSDTSPDAIVDEVTAVYRENHEVQEVQEMAQYAAVTDQNGIASITDMEQGVYLAVETETAGECTAAQPFLFSIPFVESDEWKYDVYAQPKSSGAESENKTKATVADALTDTMADTVAASISGMKDSVNTGDDNLYYIMGLVLLMCLSFAVLLRNMQKIISFMMALIMLVMLIIPTSETTYANDGASEEIICDTEEPADDLESNISVDRILITTSNPEIIAEGTQILGQYKETYLLSYETEKDAEEAYEYYEDKADAVTMDVSVYAADQAPEDEVLTDEALEDDMLTDEALENEVLTDEALEDEVLTDEALEDDMLTDEVLPDDISTDDESDENYFVESAKIGIPEDKDPLSIITDELEEVEPNTMSKYTIALIDTGAPEDDSVIEAVSMTGDDGLDRNGHSTQMLQYMKEQNPEVEVISIQALNDDGVGSVSQVYAAMEYAIARGVHFINLSLSAYASEENTILKEVIDRAASQGIIVVGAAGNEGENVENYVPGNVETAVIAGACEENGCIQTCSNYGDTVDYYVASDTTSASAAKLTGYLSTGNPLEDVLGTWIYAAGQESEIEEPTETESVKSEVEESTETKSGKNEVAEEPTETKSGKSGVEKSTETKSGKSEAAEESTEAESKEEEEPEKPEKMSEGENSIEERTPAYDIEETSEMLKSIGVGVSGNAMEGGVFHAAGNQVYTQILESSVGSIDMIRYNADGSWSNEGGWNEGIFGTSSGEWLFCANPTSGNFYNGYKTEHNALEFYNSSTIQTIGALLYYYDTYVDCGKIPYYYEYLLKQTAIWRVLCEVNGWLPGITLECGNNVWCACNKQYISDHESALLSTGLSWAKKNYNYFQASGKIYIGEGQEVGKWSYEYCPTGYLTLQKTSNYLTLSKGDSHYSLSGAVYGVYSDNACTKQVAVLTTGADGTSDKIKLNAKTYYIKEVKAPAGYQLNTNIGTINITQGCELVYKDSDTPYRKGSVKITKTDSVFGGKISGATFTLYKYSDSKGTYSKAKVLDESKGIYTTGMLYADSDNVNGKFMIEETRNPSGYTGSFKKTFTLTDTGASFTYDAVNTPTPYTIRVQKYDNDDENLLLTDAAFQIAEYDLSTRSYRSASTIMKYNSSTGYYEAKVKVTTANGGIFRITETAVPENYEGVWSKKITITANSSHTLTYFAGNEWKRIKGQIRITKTDADTGEMIDPGAIFYVYEYDAYTGKYKTSPCEELVFDPQSGSYVSSNLPRNDRSFDKSKNDGKYKVVEAYPPDGYANGIWNESTSTLGVVWSKEYVISSNGSVDTLQVFEDTVTNKKNEYHIRKTGGDGKTLFDGARFVIRRISDSKSVSVNINGNDVLVGNYDTEATVQYGEIVLRGLAPGTYEYYESYVPDGYEQDTNTYTFMVTSDGKINKKQSVTKIIKNYSTKELKIVKNENAVTPADSIATDFPAGTKFALYEWSRQKNAYKSIVYSNIIYDNGKFVDAKTLKYPVLLYSDDNEGLFKLKETASTPGYILDTTEISIQLSVLSDGNLLEEEITNTANRFTIHKVSLEGEALVGVHFNLWRDGSDEYYDCVTEDDGSYTIERLKPGTWYYQETRTLDGYSLDDTIYSFTVAGNGKIDGENTKEITIVNARESTINLIKKDAETGADSEAVTEFPAGTEFNVYEWNEENQEYETVPYQHIVYADTAEDNTEDDSADYKEIRETNLSAYLHSIDSGKDDVTVAVLDSGVRADLFGDRVLDSYYNFSTSGETDSSEDDFGHGTEIASIIIENTSENVKILPIKILNASGKGTILSLYQGIEAAIESGVDIINISTSTESGDVALIEKALREAKEAGIIVVTSAGNHGADVSAYAPANSENTIAVASVNERIEASDFSNYGDRIDYAAIGEQVYARNLDGNYGSISGTSVSAAIVTGIIASIKGSDSSLTEQEIREILDEKALQPQLEQEYIGYGVLAYTYVVSETTEENDDTDYSDSLLPVITKILKHPTAFVLPESERDNIEAHLQKTMKVLLSGGTSVNRFKNRLGIGTDIAIDWHTDGDPANTDEKSFIYYASVDDSAYRTADHIELPAICVTLLSEDAYEAYLNTVSDDVTTSATIKGISYSQNTSFKVNASFSYGAASETSPSSTKAAGTYYFVKYNAGTTCPVAFSNATSLVVTGWTQIKYMPTKVTYNANGGSGAPDSQTKYYGTDLTLSSTKPTRTGYTFMGWGTSSTATTVSYNAGGTYKANPTSESQYLSLYAIWSKTTYTIKYNANGGSGAPDSQTKTYGTDLTLSSTKPTRTGYTFKGWATSSTATTAKYSAGGKYTANAAATLYAVWSINSYTQTTQVRYQKVDGSWGDYSVVETKSVDYGSKYSWSKDKTATYKAASVSQYTVTADKTNKVSIYRRTQTLDISGYLDHMSAGTLKTYGTVTVVVNSEEVAVDENDYSATLYAGAKFSVTYQANSGYVSLGVRSGMVSGTITTEDASSGTQGDNVIELAFNKLYSITYYLNGGQAYGNPLTYHMDTETFTLNNPTRAGYTFVGWQDESGTEPQMKIEIPSGREGNLTYTALWNTAIKFVDAEDNSVPTLVETENNKGKFKIVEMHSSPGYILDETPLYLSLSRQENSESTDFDVYNTPNQFVIQKRTESGGVLQGARFAVWYDNETSDKMIYTTDTAGNITLKRLKPGIWHFQEKEAPTGYNLDTTVYNIEVNEDGTIDGNAYYRIYDTSISNTKYIIRKTDNNSNPIAQVIFRITDPSGNSFLKTTNSQGMCTLTSLTEGTYHFQEDASSSVLKDGGYIPDTTEYSFEVDSSGAVISGTTMTTVVNKKNVVQVKKVDENGNAIEGAMFVFRSAAEERTAVSNAEGIVKISGLAVGTWTYEEMQAAPGYIRSPSQGTFVVGNDCLINGQSEYKVTVVNSPTSVTLVKKDSDTQKMLAGVKLRVWNADTSTAKYDQTFETDQKGEICLKKLPYGTYHYQEISSLSGYVKDGAVYTFTLSEDDPDIRLDVDNYKNQVTIRKTDINGNALAGVYFRFVYSGTGENPFSEGENSLHKIGNRLFETENGLLETGAVYATNADGTITFSGLPEGEYTFQETQALSGYILDSSQKQFVIDANGRIQSEDQEASSEEDGKLEYEIINEKYPLATVTIHKTDENDGTDIANAQFELLEWDGKAYVSMMPERIGVSNRSGICTFQDICATTQNEGKFKVVEIKSPDGYCGTYEHTFRLYENDRVYNIELEAVNTPNRVIITKTDEDGTPLPDVEFSIWSEDAVYGTYETNYDGQIILDRLQAGTYYYQEILALKDYILDDTVYSFVVAEDGTIAGERQKELEPVINQKSEPVMANIEVKKVDADGNPMEDVTFELHQWNQKTGTYEDYLMLQYDEENQVYKTLFPIAYEDSNKGMFELVETGTRAGYYTDFAEKIKIDPSGERSQNFVFEAVNNQNKLLIHKVNEAGESLAEAEFYLQSVTDPAGFEARKTETSEDGSASFLELPEGKYILKETKAPERYGLDTAEYIFIVDAEGKIYREDDENQRSGVYEFEAVNTQNQFTLHKTNIKKTSLSGAEFNFWRQKEDGTVIEMRSGTSDDNGNIILSGLADGTWYYQENRAPEGYSTSETIRSFVVDQGYIFVHTSDTKDQSKSAEEDQSKSAAGTLNASVNIINHEIEEDVYYGTVRIEKLDFESKERLEGVEFTVYEYDTISDCFKNPWGTLIYKNGYYVNQKLLEATEQNEGRFLIRETKALDGYTADWEAEINIYEQENWEFTGNDAVFNTKNELVITKIDEETRKTLPGVTFDIWCESETGADTREAGNTSETGNTIAIPDSSNIVHQRYTTDTNGQIRISGLRNGMVYYYEEVAAKDGYILNNELRSVTVSEQGLINGEAVYTDVVENEKIKPFYVTLMTGGNGATWFYINGILLAFVLVVVNRILRNYFQV
jgi:uncharacterized repeat protein (TIGR02543 family)